MSAIKKPIFINHEGLINVLELKNSVKQNWKNSALFYKNERL